MIEYSAALQLEHDSSHLTHWQLDWFWLKSEIFGDAKLVLDSGDVNKSEIYFPLNWSKKCALVGAWILLIEKGISCGMHWVLGSLEAEWSNWTSFLKHALLVVQLTMFKNVCMKDDPPLVLDESDKTWAVFSKPIFIDVIYFAHSILFRNSLHWTMTNLDMKIYLVEIGLAVP